jgi:predicted DNA-binding antitoxin AbrB/MazE fold protein
MSIRAIYENGIFKPLEEVPLKEGTEVEVYPRAEERGNSGKRKKSVAEYEAAAGMWKDREEIGTGVEYENCMRKYRK